MNSNINVIVNLQNIDINNNIRKTINIDSSNINKIKGKHIANSKIIKCLINNKYYTKLKYATICKHITNINKLEKNSPYNCLKLILDSCKQKNYKLEIIINTDDDIIYDIKI